MRPGPNKIKPSLNGRVEIRFRAREFGARPTKVKRHDSPDQFGMFERFADQFPIYRRVISLHARESLAGNERNSSRFSASQIPPSERNNARAGHPLHEPRGGNRNRQN